ncbi:MAG TPA: Smr/MutS family protein [Steroidobacteraceae bacterium]|jgi:DNA-nicking Smr family endonuclease|nr:Smr/MutS family protein [Steroidobacteraceae bacterium]
MAKQRSTNRLDAAADADAETFRAAVRDVTPLAQTAPTPGLATPKPRLRRTPVSATENIDETMPLVGGEVVTGEAALSFARAGVRIQVMRRLRRGLYPVEDELDLHGLSQTAARDRLADFIARSRDGGRRCVRIIHGKGYRSGARGPVLKTAVNLWLRRHMDVMAFVSARPIDGGAGAVYVLLRG